jgi:VanZ like family.
MTKWIEGLAERKAFNISLLLLYFIAVVLPHKRFGTFINDVVFQTLSRDQSNLMIAIVVSLTILLFGYFWWIRIGGLKDRRSLIYMMMLNVIMAIVLINTMFVNNVEAIHFLQYFIFALLLFPLIGNYQSTLICGTLLGVLDESHQYFYLSPLDTAYFDFNDIVTDIVGVVFGLLFLRSYGIEAQSQFRFWHSTGFKGIVILILIFASTHLLGWISIYPNADRPFHLLREWPPGFWSIISGNKVHSEISYHVLRPLGGTVLTIALLWIYSRIGRTDQSRK